MLERYVDQKHIESYCIRNEKLRIYMVSGDVIITTYDEEKANKYTQLDF